jgi:hypothetical protein
MFRYKCYSEKKCHPVTTFLTKHRWMQPFALFFNICGVAGQGTHPLLLLKTFYRNLWKDCFYGK